MDFHSLARRELQSLCKHNKIPANMTNIAMADALSALHIVEGIEEFLKPSESVESPLNTSPIKAPRTDNRTSTRRKTVKEEPGSSQPSLTTSTRRVTRRTLAAAEVHETSNGVPETPTAPSTRKRVPAASARRKMETQLKECEEEEDQKIGTDLKRVVVYSTRSVRLSEKKISEPPNMMKNTEAIKIDSFTKDISQGICSMVTKTKEGLDDLDEEDICISGVELQNISEEGSENTNDLEVQNLNVASSENKRDYDDDDHHQEDSNGDSYKDENINKSVVEKSIDVENQVHDKNVGAERFDESDIIFGENVEKALDINDDVEEQYESNDSEVHKLLPNTENPNELLKLENDMVLEDSAAAMFSFDVHGDETDDAFNPQLSVNVVNDFSASADDDEYQNQDTELELPYQEDDDGDGDDIETDTELYEIEVLESKLAATHSVLPESGIQECKDSETSDHQPPTIMDSNNATEVLLFEIRVDNESDIQAVADFSQFMEEEPANAMTTETSHPVLDKNPASDMASDQSKDQTPVIEKSSEAWVGVYGTGSAAREFKMATHELSLPLENTSAASVKRSPLLAPKASVTPGKKLLSKTPTKKQEILSLVSDDKENIDNSGRKLDLTRENGKKKKNTAEHNGRKSFTDVSLRQLTKMLKEKLQISNNVNNINIDEEKNTAKVERSRPALQRLPENLLAMGGLEKEN